MASIALTVLTLTLGMFFIFVGQFKITPQFFPDIHEDMRREFGRVNKVFPFYQQTGWRPFAKNYRLAVGIAEVVGGAILVLIPGRLKQVANVVLLGVMLGAVYTHYVLHDKFERMAPGLVFSLLLITRLIIHRQVSQREKKKEKIEKKAESEGEGEGDASESPDEETTSAQEDKTKSNNNKKNTKKTN